MLRQLCNGMYVGVSVGLFERVPDGVQFGFLRKFVLRELRIGMCRFQLYRVVRQYMYVQLRGVVYKLYRFLYRYMPEFLR